MDTAAAAAAGAAAAAAEAAAAAGAAAEQRQQRSNAATSNHHQQREVACSRHIFYVLPTYITVNMPQSFVHELRRDNLEPRMHSTADAKHRPPPSG